MTTSENPSSGGLSRRRLLRQAVATSTGLGVLSAGVPGSFQVIALAAADDSRPSGLGRRLRAARSTSPRQCHAPAPTRCKVKTSSRVGSLPSSTSTTGDPLIKKIAPKVTKGLLGKQVNLLVADSGAKPNEAVQEQQKFITENKIVLMTGSTSTAVAVALNKFAQREHVLYVTGISGSNDTTGKDCVRYGFRQNFYGETAANAIGPVLVKAYGKNKKAAFMTPDYTYGHTVTKSVNDYLTKNGGWTR